MHDILSPLPHPPFQENLRYGTFDGTAYSPNMAVFRSHWYREVGEVGLGSLSKAPMELKTSFIFCEQYMCQAS